MRAHSVEAVPGIDAVCAPRQYTNTKPGSRAAAVGKLRIDTGTALAQSVLLYLCKPSRRFLPKRQYLPVTICLCPAVCVRMKLTLPSSSLIRSRPKATTAILFYHPAPSSSFATCCTNYTPSCHLLLVADCCQPAQRYRPKGGREGMATQGRKQ